ncbi:unnamed protein product [Urochloa humidicola]
MDILEHPFEAVAFRIYSLPEAPAAAAAAAWTCLAAVLAAAAAGLWRLRASSAPTDVTAAAATKPLELDQAPEKEVPTAPSRAPERWPEPAAASAAPSPKERYTAYFNDACRVGCCGGDEDDVREDEAEERDGDDGCGACRTTSEAATDHFAGWEEVVRTLPLSPTAAEMEMRLGRRRSPTALGGSVVQLWDQVSGGGLTPAASPRRRGRVVATVPGF